MAAIISIAKTTAGGSPRTVGNVVTSTVVLSNAGPDPYSGTLVDPMPAGISARSWTAVGTPGTSNVVASGSGAVALPGLGIPSGGSVTVTVQDTLSATGTYTNTAFATDGAGNVNASGAAIVVNAAPTPGGGPIDCAPFPTLSGPPPAPTNNAASEVERDVELLTLCDDNAGVITSFTRRIVFDEATGAPVSTADILPDGTPYTPTGTVGICPSTSQDTEFSILCDTPLAGGTPTQFIRRITYSDGIPSGVVDTTLNGITPYTPTGTVSTCDSGGTTIPLVPCSPSGGGGSNVNLTVTNCTPGTVNPVLVSNIVPADVNNDDPTADGLCTGTPWSVTSTGVNPPFPINEPFTGTGPNDPNAILINGGLFTAVGGQEAPFPAQVIRNPVDDPVGSGWLKLSHDGTNHAGAILFDQAFPSTDGLSLEYELAMDLGVIPGNPIFQPGNGMTIMLFDGTQPAPTALGGRGDGYGYRGSTPDTYGSGFFPNNGIAAAYLGIAIDVSGEFAIDTGAGGFATAQPSTVTVRGPGNGEPVGTPGAYQWIATQPAPISLGNESIRYPRTSPLKVRVSLSPTQRLTVEIDYNDGNGYRPVFVNLDVTSAGPTPAQLRLGLAATTSLLVQRTEIRNLLAQPVGNVYTRRLSPTFSAVPPCATGVDITVTADLTIDRDTNLNPAGDADPEYWAYLFRGVGLSFTELDRATITSSPSAIGTTTSVSLSASIAPADIGNVFLALMSETNDSVGTYGGTWDNVQWTAVTTGCVGAPPVDTVPISAPCPLSVTVTNPGGGCCVETLICADGAPAIRRVETDAAGVDTVTFLGTDGTAITPTSWVPGPCPVTPTDQDVVELPYCMANTNLIRRSVRDQTTGVSTITWWQLDGVTPFIPSPAQVAAAVPGACPLPRLVTPTLERLVGAGTINVPLFTRSVTVTVVTGNPTVSIGGQPAITLVPGLTLSWGVDDGGADFENLNQPFVFTGVAGSDFYVHTTL